VPTHTALPIRKFLAKYSIPTLPQPHYSPDLYPPDFFLLPQLKNTLKGRFQAAENIITNLTNDLNVIL
jgi:hypothetical protein